MIACTPEPPYYAVIFTSQRTAEDDEGYERKSHEMAALASQQPGYLGMEHARDAEGLGITVAYFTTPEAIRAWKEQIDHRVAQRMGRERWYRAYRIRVARVERAYGFDKEA